MANGGKWNTLVATLGGQGSSGGGTDSDAENLIDFDPADIGLPDGGTVTLTITGDVEYDETATVSEDGKVHFRVPPILTGSTITVSITIKDETGAVVSTGSKEQTLSGSSLNIAVDLAPAGSGDIIMKTGSGINSSLIALGADSVATSFAASPTPPDPGITTELLSDTGSPTEVLAWCEGTSIKYYAEGYTDSGKKIPLNADCSYMFKECSNLTIVDMSNFDTSNVTDISFMFCNCSNLITPNLSGFNTGNVTNMSWMFGLCSSLTSLDVSGFDTSNVTNMNYMFSSCSALTRIYASDSFVTTNVSTSIDMFNMCSVLSGVMGTTYNFSNPTDKTYARIDNAPSSPGYFTYPH